MHHRCHQKDAVDENDLHRGLGDLKGNEADLHGGHQKVEQQREGVHIIDVLAEAARKAVRKIIQDINPYSRQALVVVLDHRGQKATVLLVVILAAGMSLQPRGDVVEVHAQLRDDHDQQQIGAEKGNASQVGAMGNVPVGEPIDPIATGGIVGKPNEEAKVPVESLVAKEIELNRGLDGGVQTEGGRVGQTEEGEDANDALHGSLEFRHLVGLLLLQRLGVHLLQFIEQLLERILVQHHGKLLEVRH